MSNKKNKCGEQRPLELTKYNDFSCLNTVS